MIDGFIVVRKEKHGDDKYWVCLNKRDALKIAEDVTAYWKEKYGWEEDDDRDVDTGLYDRLVFNFNMEDSFHVLAFPQLIWEDDDECDPLNEGEEI